MPSEILIDPGDVEMTMRIFEEKLERLLSSRDSSRALAGKDEIAGIVTRRYNKFMQSLDKIEGEYFIRSQTGALIDECLNMAAACLFINSSIGAIERDNALNSEGPYEH